MTAREKDKYQREARVHLLMAARNAPIHLIQRVRVVVEVELRDGVKHEFVEEGWI